MRALFDAIGKKRKAIEAIKKDDRKWISRSDEVKADREKAEREIQYSIQHKKQCLEKQLERVSSFIAEKGSEEDSTGISEGWKDVPDDIVIRGLRRHKEPVLLFAETKPQRFQRLYDLEIKTKTEKRTDNVFIETIIGRKETTTSQKDDYGDAIFRKCSTLDPETKSGRIGTWISNTLLAYQNQTIKESQEAKLHGKMAEARQKDAMLVQTKHHLEPLVLMLLDGTLDEDILEKLHTVVERCEKHEYIEAHDAYMRLAIGNAAWPMGVTMVGIHERAGRSKIFTSEVAHILNDETTRNYIQMIKRLLSFVQSKAEMDPSKLVQMSNINQ